MGKERIDKQFHGDWHAIRTHNRSCSYNIDGIEAEKEYYALFDRAVSGDVFAQKALATAYYDGDNHSLVRKRSLPQAIKWFDQAAQAPRLDKDSIRTLYNIACAGEGTLNDQLPNFHDGREVMRLKTKALEYARQAGIKLGPS